MKNQFKAIIVNQSAEKFTREIKKLDESLATPIIVPKIVVSKIPKEQILIVLITPVK